MSGDNCEHFFMFNYFKYTFFIPEVLSHDFMLEAPLYDFLLVHFLGLYHSHGPDGFRQP